MMARLKQFEHLPRRFVAPLCIVIVTVVGLADYWTGHETFFFIFYLVAVFLAAWFVNITYGVLVSGLAVSAWLSANLEAGAHYSNYFIPVWNAAIMFAFYLVVVWLLAKLKNFNHELETRVRLRTDSLASEIRERMRLQKELVEAGERERQRIGHELHDGLCQHLTGTSLAGHLVSQKLAAKSAPETAETERLVTLVEEAIEMTRQLSRGLSPVEMQPERLLENFKELAAGTGARFKVDCRFECEPSAPLPEPAITAHFFRIAEESAANAARHGHAKKINICLDAAEDETVLTVTDDGDGLPENFRQSNGMGLKLMAYRADLIGATFSIERLPARGTRVTCTLPASNGEKNHVAEN
jgi:signal transduction histidine kinase